MPRSRWIPTILILMLLGLSPSLAQGQDLTMMWEFTPKAGTGASFEAALKSHTEFRKAQGDPWDWSLYQVVVGEKVGTYFALSGGHEWADWANPVVAKFLKKAVS